MKLYSSGVRHDYKDFSTLRRSRHARRALLFAAGVALPLVVVALFRPAGEEPPNQIADTLLAGPAREIRLALPPPERTAVAARMTGVVAATRPTVAGDVAKPDSLAQTSLAAFAEAQSARLSDTASALLNLVVAPGDTLDKLFRRNRLSLSDLAAMVALPEAARELTRIRPGDRLEIAARDDGQVLSLKRELDEIRLLSITRNDKGFGAEIIDRPVDIRVASAHGVIKSSLFAAGYEVGLSDDTISGIYERFKWDIDFMLDQRQGDQFTVIYEELWRDGVKLKNGEVIAAEFVNQGKVYRAARYTDPTGGKEYFTPAGRSLRKAFLRAPLNYTRVSSTFNPSRRHPVLNTIRAHRGVDYAAPTGTPVEAAGDGRIVTRGTKGGYGNTVEIDHGGGVTTLYGHLSRYARNQKVGTRVKQGEVIGYVGQSGLATGPHLHYEYRVQGVHKNPQKVPLPSADPVPAEYLSDFQRITAPLWRQLDSYRPAETATVVTTAGAD